MDNFVRFTVFGLPQAKGRQRFARRGKFVHTFTPNKTAQAENSFLAQAIKHRPQEPVTGPVGVVIKFFMPVPKSLRKTDQVLAREEILSHVKKPDIDNLVKLVLDPLNTIFWKDDSQIFSLVASKMYSMTPRTEVEIVWGALM